MKVKVYHHTVEKGWSYDYDNSLKELSKTNPSQFILEMEYTPVVEIELQGNVRDVLARAYVYTNSVGCYWAENIGNATIFGEKHRSTSVGDLIEVADALYIVESIGFRLLGEK